MPSSSMPVELALLAATAAGSLACPCRVLLAARVPAVRRAVVSGVRVGSHRPVAARDAPAAVGCRAPALAIRPVVAGSAPAAVGCRAEALATRPLVPGGVAVAAGCRAPPLVIP